MRVSACSFTYLSKLGLCYLLVLANCVPILLSYSLDSDEKYWLTGHDPALSLLYLQNSIAWFLSAELVRYEYVRRHGQAVYSHKLFWSSKVLALVIAISVDSFYHGA